jgi:hypothetical protein
MHFLQSTCLLLCSSCFAPTPPSTTSVSVRVCLLNSHSSAALIQGSFWQLSTFKRPLLRSPSINPPRMSTEIKQHPPPEPRVDRLELTILWRRVLGQCATLALVLGQCATLAVLYLCDNGIGEAGAERLAGVLAQCTALTHLALCLADRRQERATYCTHMRGSLRACTLALS